jgi:hypothetical protein
VIPLRQFDYLPDVIDGHLTARFRNLDGDGAGFENPRLTTA